MLSALITHRARRAFSLLPLLGLILWGGYVTLVFLGIEAHLPLLFPEDVWRALAQESSPFLRGLRGLLSFPKYLLGVQLRPLLSYAVVSVVLYGLFIAWRVIVQGKTYLDVRCSALHVLGLSLFSLWLLHATLFYANLPGYQQRILLEPKPEVYASVGEEGLVTLRENFQALLAGGCLREDPTRRGPGDAAVYTYRFFCAQRAFIARVLPQVALLLILTLDFLVLGTALLRMFRLRPRLLLIEGIMSLSLGAAAMMALLWFLALFHGLTQIPAWILVLGIPALGYQYTAHWARSMRERWRWCTPFLSPSVLLSWLFVSYLMFNFFTVIRPFPIGWDDLGRYLNNPRQLSAFGSIIPGMYPMQWEYLTSLGFVLFGSFSTFGATLAMEINWFAGLFAALVVFLCTKLLLGPRAGLFAALFYYTLPMVGHFSFADMKTENALFAFAAAGIIAIFLFLSRVLPLGWGGEEEAEQGGKWQWLAAAGILFAAAFGTKATIVLLMLMGGVILTFAILGSMSGFGAIFFSFAILSKFGVLSWSSIFQRIFGMGSSSSQSTMLLALLITGGALFLLPIVVPRWCPPSERLPRLKTYGLAVLALLLGFGAYAAPWMTHNMWLNGRVAIAAALSGPNTVTPWVVYQQEGITPDAPPGSRGLPPELQVDLTHERCEGTAREEELDRYWGYGEGPLHYFGLPWRVVMNIDSQGYYLTTSPLLLLLPLLLLYPFFWTRRAFRLFFLGTMMYALQWVFVGNGIPWYGIGMFLGFAVCAEALIACAPDRPTRIVASLLACISIATAFSFRMWQFDMQRNLYEYAWGKASAAVLQEMTVPEYNDVAEHVMRLSENPERPFLYRAGTFISYFIPRNLEIIPMSDNQLGFFNCLNQEEDHALTLRRLQALGFHSIIFDTNTATIERDPNGSLHQKVQRFLDFANDPAIDIIPVVNNPGGGIAYMILP